MPGIPERLVVAVAGNEFEADPTKISEALSEKAPRLNRYITLRANSECRKLYLKLSLDRN